MPNSTHAAPNPQNPIANIDFNQLLNGVNQNTNTSTNQPRQFTIADLNLPSLLPSNNNNNNNNSNLNVSSSSSSSPSVDKLDRTMLRGIVEEKSRITQETRVKILSNCRQNALHLQKKPISQEHQNFKDQFFKDWNTQIANFSKEILQQDQKSLRENNGNVKTEFISLLDSEDKDFLDWILSQLDEDHQSQVLSLALSSSSIDLKNQIVGKNVTLGGHFQALKRIYFLLNNFPKAVEKFAKLVLPKELNVSLSFFFLFLRFVDEFSLDFWKQKKACATKSAREMENATIFSCYLVLTTVISQSEKNAFNYASLVPANVNEEYPKRNVHPDFRAIQDHVRKLSGAPVECLQQILKKIFTMDKESKEKGLQWISLLLQLNDARTSVSINDQLFVETSMLLSSDGFMINLVDLLLRFCGPFMDIKGGKYKLINSNYCKVSPRFDWSRIPSLCESQESKTNAEFPSEFNFITEIFFMT